MARKLLSQVFIVLFKALQIQPRGSSVTMKNRLSIRGWRSWVPLRSQPMPDAFRPAIFSSGFLHSPIQGETQTFPPHVAVRMTRDRAMVLSKPPPPGRSPLCTPLLSGCTACLLAWPGRSAPHYFWGLHVAGATQPFLEYLSPSLWLGWLQI